MSKNYIIWKAIDVDQIENIKHLIEVGEWHPGYKTFPNMDPITGISMASNKEYSQSNHNYQIVAKIVYDAMDKSEDFDIFCFPKTSSPILISKYDVGEKMSIHEDNPKNGDFSTTLFLNDPSTYEGGELCLYINGKEEKIKLDAGYAITYETGIPHRVNRLENGQRLVIALWSKSYTIDPLHRDILNDIFKLEKMIQDDDQVYSDFELYLNSPRKIIKSIKNKILRKYQLSS
jgi:PKHD-type hydroxylase